ncbi:porin PorA family protein [Streptomyces sp. NPDC047061]|uniref:porin PorA family protein n=1 Tax=Streptomyces sp. NPDC047061 TaxID=3154605 RepID=UPI0033E6AE91
MALRRSSIVYGVLGIVLITLAAVTRPIIAPLLTRLPGNTDVSAGFSGTATVLNSKALAAGDTAHALLSGVPATMDRRVHVVKTKGDTALVADDLTIHIGTNSAPSTSRYAVDRGDFNAVEAPAGWKNVERAKGLTVIFPIHPKADNTYTYYNPLTQTTARVVFQGTGRASGHDVNRYKISVTGALKSSDVLATLPPALPKKLAKSFVSQLPAATAAALAPKTAALPDPIPLSYTVATVIDVFLDQDSGLVLDSHYQERVTANVTAGKKEIPLLPVLALDVKPTAATKADMADKAGTIDTKLLMIRTVAPLTLLGVGLLLLTIAVLRRRRPAVVQPVTKETVAMTAG